jgi:hypothetical protein
VSDAPARPHSGRPGPAASWRRHSQVSIRVS